MAKTLNKVRKTYGINGGYLTVFPEPIVLERDPTTDDGAELGTLWVNESSDNAFLCTSDTGGSFNWEGLGGGTGTFTNVTVSNILQVSSLTAGFARTSAAGVIGALADGTNGQVLIGKTGLVPAWGAITGAGGTTINLASGTIEVSSSVTGATFTTTVGGPVSPTGGGVFDIIGNDTNIATDGATANTIKVRLADDIVSVASITSTDDFDVLGGTTTIVSDDAAGQDIYLHANGGVGETIDIHSDLGTGVASIVVHSDVGGLTFDSGLASADAINITASNAAGGIDIGSGTAGFIVDTTGAVSLDSLLASNFTVTGAADLTLESTLGSVNVSSGEAIANAIVIDASAGGVDISADDFDIDVLATLGSINLTATEDAASAIYLHANGGTTETINIHSDLGTDPASINVHSDVGGLTLTSGLASDDAININATAGGVDINGILQVNIATSEAAADAIVIDASAGGIDISADNFDIDVLATLGSVNVTATEDSADAIYLHANGGVTETINIHSDLGTDPASINVHSDVGGLTLTSGLASADAININASDAAGGIDIDAGTNGVITTIVNGPFTLATGTGNVGLGSDAADHDISIGSTVGTSTFLAQSGTGSMTYTAGGIFDVNAAGAVTIDSSGGTISIGNDAVAQNMNFGTGAAARVITIGNITDATGLNFNAGTGGIDFVSTGASPITVTSGSTVTIGTAGLIQVRSSGGAINIGDDDIDQVINLGTDGERTVTVGSENGAAATDIQTGTGALTLGAGATDHTTTIGSTTVVSATTLQAGTGALTLTAGGIFDVNATDAVTIDSSAGTIGIGVDAVAQNINIGIGAAARVITIGNITDATGLAFNAGTGNIAFTSTGASPITFSAGSSYDIQAAGAVTIDSSGAAISIGADADAFALNLGTGTAAKTVTLGSVDTTSATIIQSGTGDVVVTSTDDITIDSAGLLDINSSAGVINIGNDSVNQVINIGTNGDRTINVGNDTGLLSYVCSHQNVATGSTTQLTERDATGGAIGVTATQLIGGYSYIGAAGAGVALTMPAAADVQAELLTHNITSAAGLRLTPIWIEVTDANDLTVTAAGGGTVHGTAAVNDTTAQVLPIFSAAATIDFLVIQKA